MESSCFNVALRSSVTISNATSSLSDVISALGKQSTERKQKQVRYQTAAHDSNQGAKTYRRGNFAFSDKPFFAISQSSSRFSVIFGVNTWNSHEPSASREHISDEQLTTPQRHSATTTTPTPRKQNQCHTRGTKHTDVSHHRHPRQDMLTHTSVTTATPSAVTVVRFVWVGGARHASSWRNASAEGVPPSMIAAKVLTSLLSSTLTT